MDSSVRLWNFHHLCSQKDVVRFEPNFPGIRLSSSGLFGAYYSLKYLSLADATTLGFLCPMSVAFLSFAKIAQSTFPYLTPHLITASSESSPRHSSKNPTRASKPCRASSPSSRRYSSRSPRSSLARTRPSRVGRGVNR